MKKSADRELCCFNVSHFTFVLVNMFNQHNSICFSLGTNSDAFFVHSTYCNGQCEESASFEKAIKSVPKFVPFLDK